MSRKKSKVLRITDTRSVGGGMVRELRSALRGIESGEIVSMSFACVMRDDDVRTRFDCECPVKALGSVELLKDFIKKKKFELL